MTKPRVVVAMSGGVDSSVTAALLQQQGYDVMGMMLRLWSEPGQEAANRCCTPDAMAQARKVAALLDIPFYAIDARDTFHKIVVEPFIADYARGVTPNPCLACNRQVRWEYLLKHALAIGAEFMATGHYARLDRTDPENIRLFQAVDRHKDQSYVLHVLNQDKLKHALFPLGDHTKPQVREMAHSYGIPVADRPDSQDLCFTGDSDYRSFLLRNAPETAQPGPIVDRLGQKIGQHHGLAFYTIGQRKGLGIFRAAPLYVLEKDLEHNALVVGEIEQLGDDQLTAVSTNWLAGAPPETPLQANVKIRYRSPEMPAIITALDEHSVHVRFEQPLRDITPGQAAVFYREGECLGGGIIASAGSPTGHSTGR